jgi:acyl-CoA synthetase (AMP-forming)/AMP-acid ligase II
VSLRDLLFRPEAALGVDPGAPAVHAGGETCTWDELRRRAEDVACALADAGVRAGQPVGAMLPNGIDLVAALFGAWRADAVHVPLNPRLADPEVDRILAAVAPAAVVTTEDRAPRFPEHPAVVVGGDRRDHPVVDDRSGRRPPGGDARAARFGPDVALVQFTSGTTGEPKPVLLEHAGVLRLLDGVVAKIRGGEARSASSRPASSEPTSSRPAGSDAGRPAPVPAGERRAPMANLIPVSLSLWAGIYNVLFAFRVGAPVVLMDGFDPGTFAELVRRHGIRSTVLPPAAMTALVDDPEVTDLAPLRLVRSITAPLSPLQARRFGDRFGVALLNSYGQTELGGEIVGWNAADAREHGDAKLGAVGRPHEGVELRIVDGTGELWVRTPAMAAGYADGRDLGDRISPDGWFRTGDVGRIDDDGFLWIEGRVSDMVNRGGLKVHPAEVEEVLRLSPDVADAAVVGVPDDRLGEVPWAFVVPAARRAPDPGALAALCREHLAPYKVPVRFVTIGALPRNEVGKVRKRDLVEQGEAASR